MTEKEFTTDYKTLLGLLKDDDLSPLIRDKYEGDSMICVVKDPSNTDPEKEVCALAIFTTPTNYNFVNEIEFKGLRVKVIPQIGRLKRKD